MLDYKKILGLRYASNLSGREIARSCNYSKSAVNEFLKRFRECGQLKLPLGPEVTNEAINELLYSKRGVQATDAEDLYRQVEYESVQKALAKKGETLKRLWRKYNAIGIVDGRRPYSYRQFCQKFSRWLDSKKITYHITRLPGVNLELDYAGKALYLRNTYNPDSPTKVTIFVATLSYSKYFYAEGMTCCDSRNWIRVNNNALRYFGGVTQVCTPDNAKVAVLKNMDWIDPLLNKDFQEWAAYYGTAILPAVVAGPTFKPNVESSVGHVTRNILMDMDEMTFFSLDALNAELWDRMESLNRQPFQERDYSRWDLFLKDEKEMLLALPPSDYEFLERQQVTVSQDFSFVFDHVHYTMPYRYINHALELRASAQTVYVYSKHGIDLIREHKRSHTPGEWVIHPGDLPAHATDYDKWSVPFFQNWASQVGPNTRIVIDAMIAQVPHPVQAFRRCVGVLGYAKRKTKPVLEACCADAVSKGKCTYTYIKNTIADYEDEARTASTQADKAGELSAVGQDRPDGGLYKVDGARYSIDAILSRQKGVTNG
ncbi:IS21 family transposase [Sphaerochaeta sp. UBA5849]|jgi:transposase|uniref:IS21 family transposase n=1 Tax=Sphaerochaeta sp. UBA5849 TaxID=1947475 RepID=UPI0031F58D63